VGQDGAGEPGGVGEEAARGAVLHARPLLQIADVELCLGALAVEGVDLDGAGGQWVVPGTQHVGVVDVGGAGHHGVHEGEYLASRREAAELGRDAHHGVDQLLELEAPCQRGDEQQSAVGHKTRLVEGHRDAVDQGTMMWLGAVLGLRWSEAAGLTVDRLDLLAGAITVDRQLARTGELVPPKSNAGFRTLACPQWLVDQLAALLTRRGLTAADGSALVLVGEGGKPLDYTNWRRRTWVPTCERAGLPGLRFHDLRSLAATALVAAGVDMKTAQTRLGHSSPQVTLGLYERATVAADRKAADAVGAMFAPRDIRGMDSPGRKECGVTNPA
jgi:hypothetical protein